MSLAQIKDQAVQLPSEEVNELIAFLMARQADSDAELRAEYARKIDDKDPSHWLELDELLKRYSK